MIRILLLLFFTTQAFSLELKDLGKINFEKTLLEAQDQRDQRAEDKIQASLDQSMMEEQIRAEQRVLINGKMIFSPIR